MDLITVLIACTCSSILCYKYAIKKGYNPRLWMALGFTFGLLGLLLLFLLPHKKPIRPTSSPLPHLQTIDPCFENQLWYYLNSGAPHLGPMSINALSRAFHEGKVHKSTYVWNELMDNWKKMEETFIETRSSGKGNYTQTT